MMVDSLGKNKMCSEPVYVDSFSAFQLLRYNNILAPKDAHPYRLTIFKDLERIDSSFGIRFPQELNHPNDSSNLLTDPSESVELNSDLSTSKHQQKTSAPYFPISSGCNAFDDFGRLLPDKKSHDMIGGNRLASNENSLNVSSTIGDYGHYLFHRRQRGEKRTIPEEQKDEKYFERRKRNNEAAKKSRDARKIREDRIALRAAILEQENRILRVQISALSKELATLQQIVCGRSNM